MPPAFLLPAACIIIAAAIYLMARRVEVRLVLLGAGLLMAALAGKPLAVTDTFTSAMTAAMVAPICAAMGFAAVLTLTGCDRHLVALLLAPIRRARWLALPGGMAAAYIVNLAIPSQTSTAAALGPVLIPLLLAAGHRAEIAGAALILGASFGGDLLSPAAQDVQALAGVTTIPAEALSRRVIPASLAGAACAFAVFTLQHLRQKRSGAEEEASPVTPSPGDDTLPPRLNLVKALLPLVPVALLLLAYAGWEPLQWLRRIPDGDEWTRLKGALPVVRAMLIGTLLAAAVGWREVQQITRGLFEGMGAAYASIISLTITAQCFGAGLAAAGVSDALARLLTGENGGGSGGLLARFLSIAFPWGLATLSGSGSGPVLTFAQTFLARIDSAAAMGGAEALAPLGAAACLAGSFGRTMSPVAAVVIYTSGLVGVSPLVLIRRLLPALLCGAVVALAVALLIPSP